VEIIVKASVEDTGSGIRAEDIGKLFGSFSQVDTERNKGIEGTGLGLAISKNLAKLMGGDITVKSEYGVGSVFTVTVKQSIPGEYAPLAELSQPPKSGAFFVDPGQPNAKAQARAIRFAMESLGARHVIEGDFGRLLSAVKGGGYDFVFGPDGMSGQLEELLSQAGGAAKPVLVLDYGEKSTKGKGARAVQKPLYCLPLARALSEAAEARRPAKPAKDKVSFVAPDVKALVVDDILLNLKVAKGFLSFFKIKVDTAESGQQAIDLVKENSYDIIFMDHMMPGMDGIETTGHIRRLPEGQDIPIIALTANAISGVREMFISNGLNDFISKPIERGKLENMLAEWLPKDKIKALPDASAA
jgi:CheY-like chemotaxis protein